MGNKAGKAAAPALPKGAAEKYRASFSEPELAALFGVFCSLGKATDFVTMAEFQAALGFSAKAGEGSLFLERAFRLFDSDADGRLSFAEFVEGIRCFAPASTDAKVRFSFRLYAQPGAERISPRDLHDLLAAVLKENGFALAAAQLDDMVRMTFAQHDEDGDGFISYLEYQHMCAANPSVLKHLTINVAELLQG